MSRTPLLVPKLNPFTQDYLEYRHLRQLETSKVFPEPFYFKPGSLQKSQWPSYLKGESNFRDKERKEIWEKVWGKVGEEATSSATSPISSLPNSKSDPIQVKMDKLISLQSLNRLPRERLYLVTTQDPQGDSHWEFPGGSSFAQVESNESLTDSAVRGLEESCGVGMETWFVGKVPAGVWKELDTQVNYRMDWCESLKSI